MDKKYSYELKESGVIRNPNRQNRAPKNQDTYQPEHSRLGLTPIPPAKISPHDFSHTERMNNSDLQTKINVQGRRGHLWYPSEEDSLEEVEKYIESTVSYDEVQVPEDKNPQSTINLPDVPCNQYCVCLGNDIISLTSSLEETESLIESLVFDSNSELNVNDITVFQRLELKIGICLKKTNI